MAKWRLNKKKTRVSVTLSGAEQITLWWKRICGSWGKCIANSKNDADKVLARRLMAFEKRHGIRFTCTDLDKWGYRFKDC